jgi:hypothetical protein
VAISSKWKLTVNVNNIGGLPAAFVNFKVTVPPAMSVIAVEPDLSQLRGCTLVAGVVSCVAKDPVMGIDPAPLLPGTSAFVTLTLVSPATPGSTIITASADTLNKVVDEASESNNNGSMVIQTYVPPMLTVGIQPRSTAVPVGTAFPVVVKVTNVGSVNATYVSIDIEFVSDENFEFVAGAPNPTTQCEYLYVGQPRPIWHSTCALGTVPVVSDKSVGDNPAFLYFTVRPTGKPAPINVKVTVSGKNENSPNDNTASVSFAVR